MPARRRFLAGLAGLLLGNVLLTAGFLLDGGLLGQLTGIALLGAALAAVGSALVLAVAVRDPEQFDFDGSAAARRAPTVVLLGGGVTVLAGVVELALALQG